MQTKSISEITEGLIGRGETEQSIADKVTAKGVKVTQGTINRIRNGVIREPRYSLGAVLIELYEDAQ
ncbi:hypothetical protein LCGC14_2968630 [marine sediment metagenome]|uniref:HTH cro/C1-type domain-containing protein n=1 Tax=marine sediment metagenome TaxID=412755 RepID=A0A0F8XXJ7_9ZZZZ